MAHLIGIGLDLVEVARVRRVLQRTPRFVDRVFTPDEIAGAPVRRDPAEYFAGRFAAKEAALKAMGMGLWEVALSEVEVRADRGRALGGAPALLLGGGAAEAAAVRGIGGWQLSISHDAGVAAAVAVALALWPVGDERGDEGLRS